MVSNGFLPGWAEANETWPTVCQSCVITTLVKALAIRLITGTTCSPSLTARLPPGRKQFCTSITRSADASSGLIGAAACNSLDMRAARVVVPNAVRTPAFDPAYTFFSVAGAWQSARLNAVAHGAEARKRL